MRTNRTPIPAVAALLVALAVPAFAGDLTAADAKKFVASMEDVKQLDSKLEREGKKDALLKSLMPKPGEPFAPFTNLVAALEKSDPALHKELGGLTGKHGFASSRAWGAVGDKVILAYTSIKIGEDPQMQAMVEQMTPEMLSQVPEGMREHMEGLLAVVEQMKDVPPGDVEIVRALQPELDRLLEEQGVGPMGHGPGGAR